MTFLSIDGSRPFKDSKQLNSHLLAIQVHFSAQNWYFDLCFSRGSCASETSKRMLASSQSTPSKIATVPIRRSHLMVYHTCSFACLVHPCRDADRGARHKEAGALHQSCSTSPQAPPSDEDSSDRQMNPCHLPARNNLPLQFAKPSSIIGQIYPAGDGTWRFHTG